MGHDSKAGRNPVPLRFCTSYATLASMSTPAQETTEDTVERMVKALMLGVEGFGEFEGAIGVGAVLTFTNRFLQTMVTLSPTPEDKQRNAARMSAALRHMAGVLEFQVADEASQVIH